jgi:hypothetical protein
MYLVLAVAVIVGVQFLLYWRLKVTLKDDLNQAVTDLKGNQAAVAQSITDEIAKFDAIIAGLKGSAGSVDDPTVQQVVADLTAISSNLKANAASLAAAS